MARIIGGIGTSHTPTIGFALDAGKQEDPAWKPIFEAYEPLRDWLEQQRPDVLLTVYNDHVTSFFFDHYSTFALGVDDRWAPADEGGGARRIHPLPGHAALARHIATSLVTDEFDIATFRDRPLDHGCFSPLSLFADAAVGWPFQVIPLAVGVLQAPMPTARRCLKLGQALRRGIESYPEDLRVVLVGTGGLSHQVHGERAGFNNPEWDQRFLELLTHEPATLADMTHAQFAAAGGWESAEVIMWLVMRGALSDAARPISTTYCLPSMTGIATLLLEEPDVGPDPARQQAHRERMAEQLAGSESLPGTYPFTLEVAAKAYRINAYLHAMTMPEHRALFRSDPEASFVQAGLSAEEQHMLRSRDWLGLIRHGAIFFGLEKLAAVLGIPNAAIYAAMRGETLAEFQQSRNAPGALYSVGDANRKEGSW